MNEKTAAPLMVAAQQVIDAERTLCEQLISAINTAFGEKVVVSVHIEPTRMRTGIHFEIKGQWTFKNYD